MTAVVARNLRKVYETTRVRVEALRGVSITVKKGEMVAVMGPSGCGKTTLLNCLSGLDTPTSGEVFIDGENIATMSDDRRSEYRAKKMGFVFQFYNLLPVLNAVENVELPLLLAGYPPKEARRKAMKMLELVGLKGWEEHTPAELSGGQRQRVTLARALVNEPSIVWADEPTGDLDRKSSKEVLELMVDLNRRLKTTFLIVTHDRWVAEKTHRIIKMEDGRIVGEELLKEVGDKG
ncbi:MAG: ABC transporter ATP-binding protein [Thermoplasmata archaeon]|nr:ABC transporter ATP-binding protein [Thermoplasmata archaeon]